MLWGMIPFWHKGDYRKHGLTTNNCRLEHMLESKLYRGPFQRGQRCVILCEGMYEWQTTKSSKPSERAAYMLYMPQDDENIKIYERNTWQPDNVRLLRMAGLFDVWEDEQGDKIYSYSIITFQSTKIMSWMHYRMPAILETDQQVDDWLDFKRVTNEQALAALRPATDIKWHQVSKVVNNSRNKSQQCNKPIELTKTNKIVETPQNKGMLSWLNVRKRREEEIANSGEEPHSDDAAEDCHMSPAQAKKDKQLMEKHTWLKAKPGLYSVDKKELVNKRTSGDAKFSSSSSEMDCDDVESDDSDENPAKRVRTSTNSTDIEEEEEATNSKGNDN